MVKKFYIFSCAALVACIGLFAQDAGATARHSETTAVVLGASAHAMIRLAQGTYHKNTKALIARGSKKANKKAKRKVKNTEGHSGFIPKTKIEIELE